MRDFRKYKVWAMSIQLAEDVYRVTRSFPKTEMFGMRDQLRRASVSISSNIAEGSGRNGPADFARFLGIALGSANEVESLLVLSIRLDYLNDETSQLIIQNLIEIKRILVSFRKKLRTSST
jgi:four helix bundle protein